MKFLIISMCVFGPIISTSCKDSRKSTVTTKSIITENTKPAVVEPTENANGMISGSISGCGFDHDVAEKNVELYMPRQRELQQIQTIMQFSGLGAKYKVYAANINNALATIINNQRYILYDPKLLTYSDHQSGDYWASMSILAHEIGHHLSGHTLSLLGSNITDELEADKYSGFVMYKLGSTLKQSLAAINTFGSETATKTHPSKSNRLAAITLGWNEANNQRYESAIPPPPENIYEPSGNMPDFKAEQLLDEFTYYRLFDDVNSSPTIAYNLEGIILEAAKDNSDAYLILILKNNSKFTDGNIGKNNKSWIVLNDVIDAKEFMGRAGMSYLKLTMVPGRRIKFNVSFDGNAPIVFFTSIQALPSKKE